ncbi:cyun94 [Cyclophragma undans nucleopolyhedrovirus]|uniref:Cyun94 n=1 Tax=Cyclophragma undans nucleopolyhedrovirus TaxID=1906244 RepID=A0A288QZL9_9ABAC|nr:cyun94 [Cyclophragma undans nucleopolyhedrovirus]AOT85552.1 cyun94 [Cyclophragma undans nucleopolyhedrovirus]
MKQPVFAKYLEFDNVVLDLTGVVTVQSPSLLQAAAAEEYIIFLNVKKAFYKNFHLRCDLSLETLTLLVYEKLRLTVNGVEFVKPAKFVDYISFNATDRDNSMIIDLCPDARVIVAKRLHADEEYHQRVSGFVDFQMRHCVPRAAIVTDQKARNDLDRELEIKLYES